MKNLILITGISGAGKTTASNIFEDMGYTCIDQYPVELIESLLELIKNDNSIKYIAKCENGNIVFNGEIFEERIIKQDVNTE